MEGRTSATDIIVVTEHDTVCSNRVYAGKENGRERRRHCPKAESKASVPGARPLSGSAGHTSQSHRDEAWDLG